MLIIGEKINGTLKKTAAAIAERNTAFIQDLACRQAEAGADYLDVNAGTAAGREPEDLVWLVETVQAAADLPLCLDSANPAALRAGMVRAPNSYSPVVNPERARARRDVVLGRMRELGMLSEADWKTARAEPVQISRPSVLAS